MAFEGCLNSEEKNACVQLISSNASFEAFPHERMLRLAITPPLDISLDLTIHHGPCAFSCEGADLHSCDTFKVDQYWPDASSPFYFGNCIPAHNYCITASIGECCPVCTETRFMEDFYKEYYSEDRWEWNTKLIILMILILILFLISFTVILKNYFNHGSTSICQRSQHNFQDPLTQHILEIENNNPRTQVVCLYLREHDQLSLDMVTSVQEFLRRKEIDVIDIYNEEENINRSVAKWVQDVTKKENTKILLFDTVTTRQLWNGDFDGNKILKPFEQVICFSRSCIPITNVHNHLFVIRFQRLNFNASTMVDLSDGRCYVYPIHRERLANDLKSWEELAGKNTDASCSNT